MSYRPKIKSNSTGTLVDMPLDAETVKGTDIVDSNGKIKSSVLPAIAITDTFVVSSQASMLALTAQVGDVCVRTDLNKSYILKEDGASTLSHWQELLTPTDAVSSVNGKTGAVTLSASDVGACANNDSRLSDSRTPKSHTHGNITNDGKLGTASRIVVTDSSKNIGVGSIDPANLVVTTDSRLSDARTPTSHNHGNITNNGKINTTAVSSATGVLVYDSNNDIQRATAANARSIIGAQPTLVSGTNIKTVNGNSLLGSGDIVISGGGGNFIELTGSSGTLTQDQYNSINKQTFIIVESSLYTIDEIYPDATEDEVAFVFLHWWAYDDGLFDVNRLIIYADRTWEIESFEYAFSSSWGNIDGMPVIDFTSTVTINSTYKSGTLRTGDYNNIISKIGNVRNAAWIVIKPTHLTNDTFMFLKLSHYNSNMISFSVTYYDGSYVHNCSFKVWRSNKNWEYTDYEIYLDDYVTWDDAYAYINTTSSTSRTPANEDAFSNTIYLHKIAKTGSYNDLLNKPDDPISSVKSWKTTITCEYTYGAYTFAMSSAQKTALSNAINNGDALNLVSHPFVLRASCSGLEGELVVICSPYLPAMVTPEGFSYSNASIFATGPFYNAIKRRSDSGYNFTIQLNIFDTASPMFSISDFIMASPAFSPSDDDRVLTVEFYWGVSLGTKNMVGLRNLNRIMLPNGSILGMTDSIDIEDDITPLKPTD